MTRRRTRRCVRGRQSATVPSYVGCTPHPPCPRRALTLWLSPPLLAHRSCFSHASQDNLLPKEDKLLPRARPLCRILVTGFSNIAIDNIASGLLARGLVVVRAGRGATKLEHIALHNLVHEQPEWSQMQLLQRDEAPAARHQVPSTRHPHVRGAIHIHH